MVNSEYFNEPWWRRLALLKLAFEKTVFTQDDLVNPLDGSPSIYDENGDLAGILKDDRYLLRDTLDIHIEPQGGPGSRGKYELKRIGAQFANVFLPAGLVTLAALAQLPQTAPHFPPELIRELLNDIRARLGTKDAYILDEALAGAAQLAVWRDSHSLSTDVVAMLRQAVRDRSIVVFEYGASRTDDKLCQHTVEPYEVHSSEGHLYLRCYAVKTIGPGGETPGRHYELRVGRILPDTLSLSNDRFTAERPRPRVMVHYILSRKLAKDGGSVNFDEIERRSLLDGRLEIRAWYDSSFAARRRLLGYGAQVQVLGGAEILDEYRREVQQMAAQLSLNEA